MIFESLPISGVYLVRLEPHTDERGFFARTFCGEEFAARGLPCVFEQSSLSRNPRRGTLRGMHFQIETHAEAKFVRCTRGSIYDVVIDVRRDSPTSGEWLSRELSAVGGDALYIAPGIAHGFQTMEAETDVLYQITPQFKPGFGGGVRWNDPAFGIHWPISQPILSPRDAAYPDWRA